MTSTARLFSCCLCHCLVVICSRCDRGQRYCTPSCSSKARRISLNRANKKYRSSLRGRTANAERQARFRASKKIVTHQGSDSVSPRVLLPNPVNTPSSQAEYTLSKGIVCCVCCKPCSSYVRQGYIRHRQR